MNRGFKYAALITICCLVTIPVFAQKKATTTKKVPSSGGTPLSEEQTKMLCKTWKLDTVSVYGVDSKPNAKQAGDGITFMADGTFYLIRDGVAGTGTWTYSRGYLNATIKDPPKAYSFKLISLTDGRLAIEYQVPAPDLSRIKYYYSPKK